MQWYIVINGASQYVHWHEQTGEARDKKKTRCRLKATKIKASSDSKSHNVIVSAILIDKIKNQVFFGQLKYVII